MTVAGALSPVPYTVENDALGWGYNPAEVRSAVGRAEALLGCSWVGGLSGARPASGLVPDPSSVYLVRAAKIVYTRGEDFNDKLVSVYGTMHVLGKPVLLLVRGTVAGAELYLGTRDGDFLGRRGAGSSLDAALRGNFPGIDLSACDEAAVRGIMGSCFPKDAAVHALTVVPSYREEGGRPERREEVETFVQGLERFIDTMAGLEYSALFLATPLDENGLAVARVPFERAGTELSAFSQIQRQVSGQESRSVAEGTNESSSRSTSQGTTHTEGEHSDSSDTSGQSSDHHRESMNPVQGLLNGSTGKSQSTSKSTSRGTNASDAQSTTETDQSGKGSHRDETVTMGSSVATTVATADKAVSSLVARIDGQIERLRSCASYGAWSVGCYFVSTVERTCSTAAAAFAAVVAGENTGLVQMRTACWKAGDAACEHVLRSLRGAEHPAFVVPGSLAKQTPTSVLSGKELPLVLALPRHSVSGVTVLAKAGFGRNVATSSKKRRTSPRLDLGVVSYMGQPQPGNMVGLDADALCSHCFVCGSTGSGKSNTVEQILGQLVKAHIPFLVVEPAKGEYKTRFGGLPGIKVFSTNSALGGMLRINPFAFPEDGVHVLEHLDRIIEVFSACWPLYAAMPALLKESFERAYALHGWDLANSIHIDVGNGTWPTFEDVCRLLPGMIDGSAYSADTKGDYSGALVTRVKSLTTGLVGQVFSGDPVWMGDLFDGNAVVDLSRIGSAETKALIMGTLVLQLNEYRQANAAGANSHLRHVTVLEEAHHLLRRTSQVQGGEGSTVQGKSVEMICNSIAEMRTFGEGFVIVDQSPSAVDMAAIRNTNTKIVMCLPERDDRNAAGSSMGLTDEQMNEIARLPEGHAIVFQKGWLEPVETKVHLASGAYSSGKPGKPEERAAVADFVGKAVAELYRQRAAGRFQTPPFHSIMEKSAASSDRKQMLWRRVRELVVACGSGVDEYAFGIAVSQIVGASSMLDALASRLPKIEKGKAPTPEQRRAFAGWKKLALDALSNYVATDDETLLWKVLKNQVAAARVARNTLSWDVYDDAWDAFFK